MLKREGMETIALQVIYLVHTGCFLLMSTSAIYKFNFFSFFFSWVLLRFQTTKGIWVAKVSSQQGCTLVIDTEGSDGKEREVIGKLFSLDAFLVLIFIYLLSWI